MNDEQKAQACADAFKPLVEPPKVPPWRKVVVVNVRIECDLEQADEQVRVDALVDYTIDTRRGIGDASDTILSNDLYVELTSSLTAARTWTLPAANSVTGGVHIIVRLFRGRR